MKGIMHFGPLRKMFSKTNMSCPLIHTGSQSYCFQTDHISGSYKQDTKCSIKSYFAKHKGNCHISLLTFSANKSQSMFDNALDTALSMTDNS